MRDEISATLHIYKWPSQALWRYFELQALKMVRYDPPILEIGCGDGRFSALLFQEIDEAIDINPRSIEKCRRMPNSPYRQLRCQDVRTLEPKGEGFGTVYANCVMEHIAGIEAVLAGCHRGLRPGGKLVMTVPLVEMNQHLLFPWGWYARMRQNQLAHVNLFTQRQWGALLEKVGFCGIEFRPYLTGDACALWDMLDSVASIGFGRYRVAAILGNSASKLLPPILKNAALHQLSGWLHEKAQGSGSSGTACAVVTIAQKRLPARVQ